MEVITLRMEVIALYLMAAFFQTLRLLVFGNHFLLTNDNKVLEYKI